MKQSTPQLHEVDATRYSKMSKSEKIAFNTAVINDPRTTEKERATAQWRQDRINTGAMETVLAAILLTDEYEAGSPEHDALLAIIGSGVETVREVA